MDISWKRLPDQSYERPLGTVEEGFYWDSVFARTADIIRSSQVTVSTGHIEEIIDLPNLVRAWSNVKLQFPLLGSRFYERDNAVFLNVSQDRLLNCHPNEISFQGASSCSQAAGRMLQTEDRLSNDLLARIVIARDQCKSNSFYFVFVYAHAIADGLSSMLIIRTFMNELCGVSELDRNQTAWEERLALSVASEHLNPAARLNNARRRWRSAVAAILAGRIIARFKGGHGLPQKVSLNTQYTPSRSAHQSITFPPDLSIRIIQNCRRKEITFGNAYPVIAQVAAARLLLRHYLRGEIDEDEWDFRKKEPMFSAGPVNLRPFLEPDWLAAGGMEHVCLAIGFYFYSMSFLPLGPAAELKPGMVLPEVGALLTRERFLYRAKLVQQQAKAFIRNPLLLETGSFRQCRRVERMRESIQTWRESTSGGGPPLALNDRIMTPMEQAAGLVLCNGGSSIGNMDKLLPHKYPTTSQDSAPKTQLQLGQVMFRLRCRPGELYLGAATMHNQLTSFVHFDSNVFDQGIMDEWLNEIKMALEFYLVEDM